MKYYLSVVHDRHADPVFQLFEDRDEANQATIDRFRDSMTDPKGVLLDFTDSGLARLRYAYERDQAYVIELELKKDPPEGESQ